MGKVCQNCGNKLKDDAKFCGKCGSKYIETTQGKANERKCQKCGTELKNSMKFCPKCGSEIVQPPIRKKKSKKKIIVIAAVILLTIIIFMTGEKQDSNPLVIESDVSYGGNITGAIFDLSPEEFANSYNESSVAIGEEDSTILPTWDDYDMTQVEDNQKMYVYINEFLDYGISMRTYNNKVIEVEYHIVEHAISDIDNMRISAIMLALGGDGEKGEEDAPYLYVNKVLVTTGSREEGTRTFAFIPIFEKNIDDYLEKSEQYNNYIKDEERKTDETL